MRQVELLVTLYVEDDVAKDTVLTTRVTEALHALRDAKIHFRSSTVKLAELAIAARARAFIKRSGRA